MPTDVLVPTHPTDVDGTLFFMGYDVSLARYTLWKTDGGTATLVTEGAGEWAFVSEMAAVDGAVKAGREANLPVMVDFGRVTAERNIKTLMLDKLRPGDVYSATLEGAGKRLRPKTMTVATSIIGLIPLMWATGIGSDVMKFFQLPMPMYAQIAAK